jgi:hypothetical protein
MTWFQLYKTWLEGACVIRAHPRRGITAGNWRPTQSERESHPRAAARQSNDNHWTDGWQRLSGIRSRPIGRTVIGGWSSGGAGRKPAAQQQVVQKPCTAGSAETLSQCAFGVTVVPLCPAEDALSNAQKLLAMHT